MADRILKDDQIHAYADLSHDHNPLHVDEAMAAASPFGSIVAHGFLLLGGPLAELVSRKGYPKTLECRFEAPGRPGDALSTSFAADGTFVVSIRGEAAVRGRVRVG